MSGFPVVLRRGESERRHHIQGSAMSIRVECGECFHVFQVPEKYAGKTGKCRACGARLTVPAAEEEQQFSPWEADETGNRFEASNPRPRASKKKKARGGTSLGRRGTIWIAIALISITLKTVARIGAHLPGRGIGNVANAVGGVPADKDSGATADLFPAQEEATKNPKALFPLSAANIDIPTFDTTTFRSSNSHGVRIYDMKTPVTTRRPGYPGTAMQFRVYLPPGEHASGTLPCVLVPPAGTPLIYGTPIDTDVNNPEHRPYVDAGFVVVTFSLDGWVLQAHPTNADIQRGYREFSSSFAGLVNTRAAMRFVREQLPVVNSRQIFIAGHSSAGTLALLFAAHEPELAGCVAYAPNTDVVSHVHRMLDTPQQQQLLPGVMKFAEKSSPRTHVAHVKCPTFLFHAANDQVTSAAASRQYYEQLKTGNARAEYLGDPGSHHYETMITSGIPAGLKWMQEQIQASPETSRPVAGAEASPAAPPTAASASPDFPKTAPQTVPPRMAFPSPSGTSSASRNSSGPRSEPPAGVRAIRPEDKLEAGMRVIATLGAQWEVAEIVSVLPQDRARVHFLKLPVAFDRDLSYGEIGFPLAATEVDPDLVVTLKFALMNIASAKTADSSDLEKELQMLQGYLPETAKIDRKSMQISVDVIRGSMAERFVRSAFVKAHVMVGRRLDP